MISTPSFHLLQKVNLRPPSDFSSGRSASPPCLRFLLPSNTCNDRKLVKILYNLSSVRKQTTKGLFTSFYKLQCKCHSLYNHNIRSIAKLYLPPTYPIAKEEYSQGSAINMLWFQKMATWVFMFIRLFNKFVFNRFLYNFQLFLMASCKHTVLQVLSSTLLCQNR